MKIQSLTEGYKQVINYIYSPKNYYQRLINFLKEYKPKKIRNYKIDLNQMLAFLKSIWILGVKKKKGYIIGKFSSGAFLKNRVFSRW